MRISNDTIQGLSTDEVIDFIANHRYTRENVDLIVSNDFAALPTYIKDFIYILDFESEYEINGIRTLLGNSIGDYIEDIIDSFRRTNNREIASLINQLVHLNNEDDLDEMNKKLRVEILEKEFWNSVISNFK